jgi:hypothetical protein
MSVALDEHRLGSLRWIVLTGPDRAAFRALGEHIRGELTALAQAWPALTRLRRHVSGSPGRDRLSAVRRATKARFGPEWAELAAFAEGAAVPLDDLALLNFRGDLGLVEGGIGCSDLAWRRERSVIAHNEDGAPEDVGRCGLLTLATQRRPPVTAFWSRPRPDAMPSWRPGPRPDRCSGTPTTAGTSLEPSRPAGEPVWRGARYSTPSPSRPVTQAWPGS